MLNAGRFLAPISAYLKSCGPSRSARCKFSGLIFPTQDGYRSCFTGPSTRVLWRMQLNGTEFVFCTDLTVTINLLLNWVSNKTVFMEKFNDIS